MKTLPPLSVLLLLPGLLIAQQPPASPTNSPVPLPSPAQSGSPASSPPPPARGPMGNLSDAEKAQVKAAHDKAIQQDPTLEQRMKEARQAMDAAKKAMHDAMVRADPSVEPILAKMAPPPKSPGAPGANPPPPHGVTPPSSVATASPTPTQVPTIPGLANLTDEERAKIKALHEQVKNDPAVVAARQALDAATPEGRPSAEEALHKARRDAMIKADPSVEALFSKIGGPAESPLPSSFPRP